MAKLTIGGPAKEDMQVVEVLSSKLEKHVSFRGGQYLDVGCGNGSFTERLGRDFSNTIGIDIEPKRLREYQRKIREKAHRSSAIVQMTADHLGFQDRSFDVVTAIEVIEHIPKLERAMSEIARVVRRGGIFAITCPNRLFPFETHGIWWRGKEIKGRFPLLPYLPPLHRRLALARVFSVRDLDKLLVKHGFQRIAIDYAYPTFERGHRLGRMMRPTRKVMRYLENSPLRRFGVSIVAIYRKK